MLGNDGGFLPASASGRHLIEVYATEIRREDGKGLLNGPGAESTYTEKGCLMPLCQRTGTVENP